MKDIFYRVLIALSKRMGLWVFRFMAWFVASGYFFLFPGRVAASLRFYGALFPSRGLLYHLWCAWRQYHNFTNVYLDRFLVFEDHNITITPKGWEFLEDAVNRKVGGIILMSHVGNWELAAHMLKMRGRNNPEMKLLLYLGQKNKDQIERTQKERLVQSGVKIIIGEENGGSPADIIEGINFLKAGGFVSLTGDRIWRKNQRSIPVRFLGHEAFLPETPFIFALLSGAPLFIFLGIEWENMRITFKSCPRNMSMQKTGRADRKPSERRLSSMQTVLRRPCGIIPLNGSTLNLLSDENWMRI